VTTLELRAKSLALLHKKITYKYSKSYFHPIQLRTDFFGIVPKEVELGPPLLPSIVGLGKVGEMGDFCLADIAILIESICEGRMLEGMEMKTHQSERVILFYL
jgi:hypothetical protein